MLPDGTPLPLDDGATGADAAAAIGPGLARAALAVKVDGELRDLARPLPDDGPNGHRPRLEILTERSGEEALALIRHDAAHVLAAAMLELYPGVKISIGPAIENGFYYDFEFPEGVAVGESDLPAIEDAMQRHIDADETFTREDVTVEEALRALPRRGPALQGRADRGPDRDADRPIRETVSLYTNGPFTDLCRGPHAPTTKRIKAFKLQSVAGSYWRGDAIAPDAHPRVRDGVLHSKDLAAYLEMLEQARARDHRRLGRELGLFDVLRARTRDAAFWQPPGPRSSTR